MAVFLFGLFRTAPEIEASTQAAVRDVLARSGYGHLEVEADGQEITIRGEAPASASVHIEDLARGAARASWIGQDLVCPTNIHLDLAGTTPASSHVDPTVSKARPHDFTFRRTEDALVLDGEVPDEATRQSIVNQARQHFPSVTDRLVVSGESATEWQPGAITRAWNVLQHYQTGQMSWLNTVFFTSGRLYRADEAALRAAFADGAEAQHLGDIKLQIIEDVDRCNEEFRVLLSASTIRFETSSANIAPESRSLLESLAALAKDCRGDLDIEGHTDSQGPADYNQTLSLARAESVARALADLGVDPTRLHASGFGQDRPVADNDTPQGRAQNRRIEIKMTGLQ